MRKVLKLHCVIEIPTSKFLFPPSKKQFKHQNKIYIYTYDFMQSDITNKTPLNILISIHKNFTNNNGAAK